ncbi:MAG: rhomboid family intramembrane serine protease [Spirochaetes bacterium]|nr:MAG: rhomboid family intramembrane serine protease [Spirochaetota bacterium]
MRAQQMSFRLGGPITPVVKKLMIINAAVFLIQELAGIFEPGVIESYLGLNHQGLVGDLRVWQLFTYMFLHGGWFHIIFNLLGLWMFAGDLENHWGSGRFLKYYLFTGIGAGIFIALMNSMIQVRYLGLLPPYQPTTIGASGALYGLLLAYGMTWPNREVLLYFLFPIKMKYLVLIFGALEFFGTLSSLRGVGGNVSHIGHMGGIVTGLVLMMAMRSGGRERTAGPGPIGGFLKKLRLAKKQRAISERIEAKEIIDTLLDKIARQGMSALTAAERKKLEWARRHYYPEKTETIH